MSVGALMRGNPSSQGYCLSGDRLRQLRVAVRFPTLPPNPRRRRHAAGLILGGILVVACTSTTVLNLCLPSEALARWDRRRTTKLAHAL